MENCFNTKFPYETRINKIKVFRFLVFCTLFLFSLFEHTCKIRAQKSDRNLFISDLFGYFSHFSCCCCFYFSHSNAFGLISALTQEFTFFFIYLFCFYFNVFFFGSSWPLDVVSTAAAAAACMLSFHSFSRPYLFQTQLRPRERPIYITSDTSIEPKIK